MREEGRFAGPMRRAGWELCRSAAGLLNRMESGSASELLRSSGVSHKC
jgi:hypothetical protein